MAPFDLVLPPLFADETIGVQPEKAFCSIFCRCDGARMTVNAIGPALIMKYFLPLMARDKKGGHGAFVGACRVNFG